jgi:steroid 5-alpha reductase family enzyme
MLQLLYLLIIVSPVLYMNTFRGPSMGALDWAGLTLWIFGFGWEVIGDHQLRRFKEKRGNKGHVLRTGLWRYSRHPNYFGDIMLWAGFWLMTVSIPGGWVTFIGPLFLTILLVRIRAIPLLEKHFSANPEYLAYQKSTNMLFPWVPGK